MSTLTDRSDYRGAPDWRQGGTWCDLRAWDEGVVRALAVGSVPEWPGVLYLEELEIAVPAAENLGALLATPNVGSAIDAGLLRPQSTAAGPPPSLPESASGLRAAISESARRTQALAALQAELEAQGETAWKVRIAAALYRDGFSGATVSVTYVQTEEGGATTHGDSTAAGTITDPAAVEAWIASKINWPDPGRKETT